MERFTLTEQHLKLLKRMWVYWEDGAYAGAPSIDIKRPYGNSDVWQDVAEICGVQQFEDDDGEKHYPKGTKETCMALHRETEKALQVVLASQSFVAGDYVADEYRNNWRIA